MTLHSRLFARLSFLYAGFLALTCCYSGAVAADVPSARLDLRDFGYRFPEARTAFADYSDLSFISDDLLVVSINQRGFGPVEPMFADTPESTILVFDVKRTMVRSVAKMSVEKMSGSVQAISGERFAVLNEKGLQFCDATLKCGRPIEAQGPMFISPRGKWIAVGGNDRSLQKVIDGESLKQVAAFEHGSVFQLVIPGEGVFLVSRNQFGDDSVIQRPGKQDAPLTINSRGNFSELRFLNSDSLACLDHDSSEVVLTDMDARPIRRYKVAKAWRTGILTAASGTRFGIYEHGYTALNSLVTSWISMTEGHRTFNASELSIFPRGSKSIRSNGTPGLISQSQFFRRAAIASPALGPVFLKCSK